MTAVFPHGGHTVPAPSDFLPNQYQTTIRNPMAPDGVGLRDTPPQWFRREDGRDDGRLRGYRDALKLRDISKHRQLAMEHGSAKRVPGEENWIPLDLPGMLARLARHYTFGRDFNMQPTVSGDAAEATVTDLVSGMRLVPKFRQASEEGLALGDAVFRVAVEDEENDQGEVVPVPVLKYVAPWHYFPELDPMDADRVVGVTFAWVMDKPRDLAGDGEFIVLREVHEPGSVRYALNLWNGVELGDRLPHAMLQQLIKSDLPEESETGINRIPVVHVGYNRAAGDHWGRSEFPRILRIVTKLESRLSQEDEVLDKHARPKLIVGPGFLDEDGNAPGLEHFEVIEVDPGLLEKAVKPEYLTWEMQLPAIQHEIEKLEEYLFMTTETSPASFGLERDGSQVESARALKFKAHRTVNKVNDYRDEWTPAIQDIVKLAQGMWNAALEQDGMEARARTGVRIVWGDAIIEDDTQEAETYTMLKSSGLASRKRAVRDLYNLSDAEADAEVQEILQDAVDEAAAASVGVRPPAPAGGQEPDEEQPDEEQPDEDTLPEDVEPDAEV